MNSPPMTTHPHHHETPSADWGRIDPGSHARLRMRAWAWAIAAAGMLIAVYVATLVWADSLRFAAETFQRLWYWMVPLVLGFAAQVGLFAYVRGAGGAGQQAHGAGVAVSGGASGVSMVACCAHHLSEVLPLLGFAGISLFLTSYQYLFLLAGVLSNAVGSAYMLGIMGRHQLYPSGAGAFPWLLRRMPAHSAALVSLASGVIFGIALAVEFIG